MTINPQPLDRLKELSEKATQGEWRRGEEPYELKIIASRYGEACVLAEVDSLGNPWPHSQTWQEREANANLIVASVNYVRSLLTSSSGIREQALEEAVEAAFKEAYELGFLEGYECEPRYDARDPDYREAALRHMDGLPEAWSDYRALAPKPLDPPHRQQASDEADVNLAEARRMFVNGEFALSGYTNDQILHGDADHHYALQRTVKAIERGRQLAGGEDDPSVRLTAEYRAMSPLQKWETLCLHGLIDTNEPWIEDMRQSLLRQERQASPQSSSVHPDVERVAEEVTTAVYRKFKDWSKRGFTAEDVTWCEVKAEITRLVQTALSPANILHEASAIREAEGGDADAEAVLRPTVVPHVEDGSR